MKQRTVRDLVSREDDAWEQVLRWVEGAVRPVEVLPLDSTARGAATLFALQVTTRSPMGAIAFRSGGIIVERGWMRILGAGHERVGGGLREWNGLDGSPALDPPLPGALIVAYDAVGGFLALNGGAWEGGLGTVHYFPPDAGERQALDFTYSGFLEFAFGGDLDQFYSDHRWPGWEDEVADLGRDEALSVYPFLGFRNEPIELRSRRPVPARELWGLYRSLADQLRRLPDGAQVEVQVSRRPPGDIGGH
jgi:hypothetical protein